MPPQHRDRAAAHVARTGLALTTGGLGAAHLGIPYALAAAWIGLALLAAGGWMTGSCRGGGRQTRTRQKAGPAARTGKA